MLPYWWITDKDFSAFVRPRASLYRTRLVRTRRRTRFGSDFHSPFPLIYLLAKISVPAAGYGGGIEAEAVPVDACAVRRRSAHENEETARAGGRQMAAEWPIVSWAAAAPPPSGLRVLPVTQDPSRRSQGLDPLGQVKGLVPQWRPRT